MREDFKVGVTVSFKNENDYDKWFVKSRKGVILETRDYGPHETMVTVDFEGKRAHVSHIQLEIIRS